MRTSGSKTKAIGLFSFDADTDRYELQASVKLGTDGQAVISGAPVLVERLRNLVLRTAAGPVIAADGQAYIEALLERYTDPHLKAMPLLS